VQRFSSGDFSFSINDIFNNIINSFLNEVKQSGEYLIIIITVTALSSLITILGSSIKNKQTADTAFFACFTILSGIMLKILMLTITYASDVIVNITDFITKFSPIMLGLMLTSGNITSAAAFKPILSYSVYVITLLSEKCIFPLICFGTVMSVINNLGGQISNFVMLIKSTARCLLTGILTVFTGLTAIYGFTAPGLDTLTAKTAKFAIGSLVPVVGGLLSDAVDTVVGSSVIMKNAVGVAGVISICGICLIPILKTSAIVFMLKLSAAATEPLADKRISNLLRDSADTINMVLGMMITVSVMLIICISIMIATTTHI